MICQNMKSFGILTSVRLDLQRSIFGFDENAQNISRRNFFDVDTLPYAQEGTLQELVNDLLADRINQD